MPTPDREQLIKLLAEHAYQTGKFTLASGRESDFYLDVKEVTYRRGGSIAGKVIAEYLAPYDIEAIGGLTLGADALTKDTMAAMEQAGHPIDGFIVRKEPKGHGRKRFIEGVLPAGKRVAIVDDVITTGSSVLQAVEEAKKAGAIVAVVIGLVDREEGGAENIRRQGLKFQAICTLSEVRQMATAAVPA